MWCFSNVASLICPEIILLIINDPHLCSNHTSNITTYCFQYASSPTWSKYIKNKVTFGVLLLLLFVQTDSAHKKQALWPWRQGELCHSWSVKRISTYILSCGFLLLCLVCFPVLANTHASVRPSRSPLLVALSASVPPSSLLNPATAESHFIPPLVYLPSLSVYLSLAHCLVILSSSLSVPPLSSP